jgi:hypothetical protein
MSALSPYFSGDLGDATICAALRLTTQTGGPGLAPPHHKPAGDCLASGDSDDETDELTLDAAAVVAEEAVERKERWFFG